MTLPSNSSGVGLSYSLAFVGGFGDAASFVLAKTFTGHITGSLVLAAVSIAALDWGTTLVRLSAIFSFLAGTLLSVASVRLATARRWPPLTAAFVGEFLLIGAGSLAPMSHTATGTEIFVVSLSLALGLQNGAFRRAGGMSVHTTYLTGMLTSLMVSETEKLIPPPRNTPAPNKGGIRLLYGIWLVFFIGAATGAAVIFQFGEAGMLAVVALLGVLIVRTLQSEPVWAGKFPGS